VSCAGECVRRSVSSSLDISMLRSAHLVARQRQAHFSPGVVVGQTPHSMHVQRPMLYMHNDHTSSPFPFQPLRSLVCPQTALQYSLAPQLLILCLPHLSPAPIPAPLSLRIHRLAHIRVILFLPRISLLVAELIRRASRRVKASRTSSRPGRRISQRLRTGRHTRQALRLLWLLWLLLRDLLVILLGATAEVASTATASPASRLEA
jgi:hypothetical protein